MEATTNSQTFAARMEAVVQTLKPCPFCASRTLKPANVIVDDSGVNDFSEVFCAKCGTRGPKTECWESAAERWNRRSCVNCDGRGCRRCNPTHAEAALLERALAVIADAIMHGMPITDEVADLRNQIVKVL